jgi:hypothetical protein
MFYANSVTYVATRVFSNSFVFFSELQSLSSDEKKTHEHYTNPHENYSIKVWGSWLCHFLDHIIWCNLQVIGDIYTLTSFLRKFVPGGNYSMTRVWRVSINQAHKALADFLGMHCCLSITLHTLWYDFNTVCVLLQFLDIKLHGNSLVIFVRHKETSSHGIVFSKPEFKQSAQCNVLELCK